MPNHTLDEITSIDLEEKSTSEIPQELSSSELFLPTQYSKHLGRGVAAQTATIRNSLDPTKGVNQYYLEAKAEMENTGDPNSIIEQVVGEFKERYRNELTFAMEAGLSDEDAIEKGMIVNDMANELDEEMDKPYALETAQILSISGDVERGLALNMFFHRKVSELSAGNSTWDSVVNFAGLFIPDTLWDLSDMTGGSMLTALGASKEFFANFQQMSDEEKVAAWPGMVSLVMEATDENEMKASMRLLQAIDPSREDEVNTDVVLDLVDIATLIPISKIISKASKGYNAIKTARNAGDEVNAAKANAAVLADETGEVAKEMGIKREVAAYNATPWRFEDVLPEATDGIASPTNTVLNQVSKIRAKVREKLEPTISGRNYLAETSLTPNEKKLVQENEMSKLGDLKDSYYESQGWTMSDAVVSGHTDEGFTLAYQLEGIPQTKSISYSYDEVGNFKAMEAGAIEVKLFSPTTWANRFQQDVVEIASRIGFAQTRILSDLNDASRMATAHLSNLRPLKKFKSLNKIDEVLLSGDDANKGVGRVYTIKQLMYEGIETDSGLVRLTGEEAASYYALRDVYAVLHNLQNKNLRNTYVFNKFKEVKLSDDVGDEIGKVGIGRPYAINEIPPEFREGIKRVWDSKTKSGADSSTVDLQKRYDEGYTLVKFKDKEASPGVTKDGDVIEEFYNWGLIKNEGVSDLRGQVLNKKVGYIPKIYKDGFYFVKQFGEATVDGVRKSARDGGTVRTMRVFDNIKDAKAYTKELQAADKESKFIYDFKADREMTLFEIQEEMAFSAGGTFTSSRASTPLLYGLGKGDKPRRINAFAALERNLSNISNNLPMNDFRMGLQQRWLNTARPFLQNPNDFRSKITAPIGSKEEVGLEAMRTWINDILRVPTADERRFEAITRQMSEWMEGKAMLDTRIPLTQKASIRRGVLLVGTKDPFAAMRASAFHALLGWFNPAQLWVQAQGASVALALDPLSAPKHIAQYTALRASWFIKDNPEALAKTMKAAKKSGIDTDELEATLKQLDKSSLMQSVKTTADHGASQQSYFIGADALRRVADKGLVFFREGEMFTRGYSFLVARDAFIKKTGKLGKDLDDDDLKEIVNLTLKKMLNMNRANRAHWQKGALGIPTQFQQVTAKFIENMLPNTMKGSTGKFTGQEKARIMLFQTLLYGGASVPLGVWGLTEMSNLAGYPPGTLPESTQAAMTDGFWGWLAEEAFGARVDLGQRGAFLSGVESTFLNIAESNSISELALGAFGEVPNRIFKGLGQLAPLLANPIDTEWTKDEAVLALTSFTDVISTFNNFHKAQMWEALGEVRDNKGQFLFDIDKEKDLTMIWTKKLGFQPSRVSDFYDLKKYKRSVKEKLKEKETALLGLWKTFLLSDKSEDNKKNFRLHSKWLGSDLSDYQWSQIRARVAQRVGEGKDLESQAVLDALTAHFDGDASPTAGNVGLTFNSNLASDKQN